MTPGSLTVSGLAFQEWNGVCLRAIGRVFETAVGGWGGSRSFALETLLTHTQRQRRRTTLEQRQPGAFLKNKPVAEKTTESFLVVDPHTHLHTHTHSHTRGTGRGLQASGSTH